MEATDTPLARANNGGAERRYAVPAAGAATELDLANGNVHTLTLTAATCAITVAALAHTGANVSHAFTLVLVQDATGGRTVDWSGMTIKWPGGTAPTLTAAANAIDVITLLSTDDGATWFGFASGLDMQ